MDGYCIWLETDCFQNLYRPFGKKSAVSGTVSAASEAEGEISTALECDQAT